MPLAILNRAKGSSAQLDADDDGDDLCTREHCFHAFDTLFCALTLVKPIPPSFKDEKYPLFVTWNTRSARPGHSSRLRGCIGNFEAMPLSKGIAEYALISAFHDSRFRRIEEHELKSLECGYVDDVSFHSDLLTDDLGKSPGPGSISLLTDYEDAEFYLDWTIGVHGIYISFTHPLANTSASSSDTPTDLPRGFGISKQKYTATYLPDVIPDQGWSQIEAVDSAIHKSGWTGKITSELRKGIRLQRFQSRKCVVSFDEYIVWRKQQEGKA